MLQACLSNLVLHQACCKPHTCTVDAGAAAADVLQAQQYQVWLRFRAPPAGLKHIEANYCQHVADMQAHASQSPSAQAAKPPQRRSLAWLAQRTAGSQCSRAEQGCRPESQLLQSAPSCPTLHLPRNLCSRRTGQSSSRLPWPPLCNDLRNPLAADAFALHMQPQTTAMPSKSATQAYQQAAAAPQTSLQQHGGRANMANLSSQLALLLAARVGHSSQIYRIRVWHQDGCSQQQRRQLTLEQQAAPLQLRMHLPELLCPGAAQDDGDKLPAMQIEAAPAPICMVSHSCYDRQGCSTDWQQTCSKHLQELHQEQPIEKGHAFSEPVPSSDLRFDHPTSL